MSSEGHDSYDHANKMETANGGSAAQLERLQTAGGHVNDRSQPALPVVHRNFANPAPLGLLSFATGKNSILTSIQEINHWAGIFLISIFGVKVRGVATPNVLIGVLIFFGGVCQFIAGIMEFVSGNTVGYTFFFTFTASKIISSSVQLCSPHMEPSTYHTA